LSGFFILMKFLTFHDNLLRYESFLNESVDMASSVDAATKEQVLNYQRMIRNIPLI